MKVTSPRGYAQPVPPAKIQCGTVPTVPKKDSFRSLPKDFWMSRATGGPPVKKHWNKRVPS
eukprot:10516539-Lingulodinium_polyedra.AAC.1